MSNKPDGSYEVGFGKPPAHTRFKKGQSGNPKGRPRGAKNISTLVSHALDERVEIKEAGQRRMLTKREVIAKQLVNKSAGSDLKALSMLLGLMRELEGKGERAAVDNSISSDADQQVVQTLLMRLRENGKGVVGGED